MENNEPSANWNVISYIVFERNIPRYSGVDLETALGVLSENKERVMEIWRNERRITTVRETRNA